MTDVTSMGCVYLVGAGPGDICHLTLLAKEKLAIADVLIYDALVDERLLTLLPSHCQTVDVGKRGGQPSTSQTTINRLLVNHCQSGQQVVRLKSGDPFIFGRCAAEIQALQDANCPFEVVPGLSSALAAPLLAHIPLTDPVLSRSFTVCTAHDPEELHWVALDQIETLVFMMGTRHLNEIVHQLQRHGRSPQTPIAVIRWAGHPQQQIWTGTLETIGQQTSRQDLSPAVIVVGEVVELRQFLQCNTPKPTISPSIHPSSTLSPQTTISSLENQATTDLAQPLQGKTVLVTRSSGQSSQFTTLLQDQGATVLEMPAIDIMPPSSWQELDEAIAQLAEFHWLILTSTNGVDYFLERLQHHGLDTRALAGLNIAVVGKKTAQHLQQRGLTPDFIPPNFVADSLVETFPVNDLSDIKILFPRVETGGRQVLVNEFTERGARVTDVPAYQSGCAQAIAPEIQTAFEQGTLDIMTFASSKTVKCTVQLLHTFQKPRSNGDRASDLQTLLQHLCIASIGPQTSVTCQELLGRVDVEAAEYTLDGLTAAIVAWTTHSERGQRC